MGHYASAEAHKGAANEAPGAVVVVVTRRLPLGPDTAAVVDAVGGGAGANDASAPCKAI